jgi:hypothetical protein
MCCLRLPLVCLLPPPPPPLPLRHRPLVCGAPCCMCMCLGASRARLGVAEAESWRAVGAREGVDWGQGLVCAFEPRGRKPFVWERGAGRGTGYCKCSSVSQSVWGRCGRIGRAEWSGVWPGSGVPPGVSARSGDWGVVVVMLGCVTSCCMWRSLCLWQGGGPARWEFRVGRPLGRFGEGFSWTIIATRAPVQSARRVVVCRHGGCAAHTSVLWYVFYN